MRMINSDIKTMFGTGISSAKAYEVLYSLINSALQFGI